MSPDKVPGDGVGFVRQNLEEVKLLCGVVLVNVVGLE